MELFLLTFCAVLKDESIGAVFFHGL